MGIDFVKIVLNKLRQMKYALDLRYQKLKTQIKRYEKIKYDLGFC